jgi:hypothetical protein
MRANMSCVIVERPRRSGFNHRGRPSRSRISPAHEGMRGPHLRSGGAKELNENLSPLRRYLEREVGRAWNKVYSEIATHLRADNTVQQHVRDHLHNFVAIKPRRRHGSYFTYPGGHRERFARLWYQPLYVDERDGILKHTDRLPEEKARLRARRKPTSLPVDRIALARDREFRRRVASRRCLMRSTAPLSSDPGDVPSATEVARETQ